MICSVINMDCIVNIFRGQPRNYYKITIYNIHIGLVTYDDITFPQAYDNFEMLLMEYEGSNAGIVLARILGRLGC